MSPKYLATGSPAWILISWFSLSLLCRVKGHNTQQSVSEKRLSNKNNMSQWCGRPSDISFHLRIDTQPFISKSQVFCNVTLCRWVSSQSGFEGLHCLHIQGHTVQQEYPHEEKSVCYTGTTDGEIGRPGTAVTVGSKRCV